MCVNLLEAATAAITELLIGKRVEVKGERGCVVGIDLTDNLPVKVRFDDQDGDDEPWSYAFSQLAFAR